MATTIVIGHTRYGGVVRPHYSKPDLWFDYGAQVWVRRDIVQRCGHPPSMRGPGGSCCNQDRFSGMFITEARTALEICACGSCIDAEWQKQI